MIGDKKRVPHETNRIETAAFFNPMVEERGEYEMPVTSL